MIPTPGVIALPNGHIIGIADIFGNRWGLRFCPRCDIGMDERRCFVCGRFTTKQTPTGWHETSTQRHFTGELEGTIHARTYLQGTDILGDESCG